MYSAQKCIISGTMDFIQNQKMKNEVYSERKHNLKCRVFELIQKNSAFKNLKKLSK